MKINLKLKIYEIKNSGNLIVAKNGKFNSPDGELIIIADRFQYNKENKILNIFNGEAIIRLLN